MYAALLCLSFAAGPAQDPNRPGTDAATKLDGNWTVVCFEKNGQPMADAKNATVTIKDNTITVQSKDPAKPTMTFKIDFAKQGQIEITNMQFAESAGTTAPSNEKKNGVYVLTQDYLAICVHHDKDGTASGPTNAPQAKSHCSIVMRREGSKDR